MEKRTQSERAWSEQEFKGVDLGDKRLEARLKQIAGELAALPEAPINQASQNWAATKAAYRFFQNERATSSAILKPHVDRTVQRMCGEKTVLVIQDTSYLNFNKHSKTRGLGPIGDGRFDSKGLVMHTALAITSAGLPLGLLASQIWARHSSSEQSDRERRNAPIEDKESYRWIETLRETAPLMPEGTRLVTICDRECDIYEFFVAASDCDTDFVVRASADRRVDHPELGTLWKRLKAEQCKGSYQVSVTANAERAARKAQVEVRFTEVELVPPHRKGHTLPAIRLYAIHVKETNSPAKTEPIEWMLLTNVPVKSFSAATERIAWYCCRWQIEVFHKILKSGCTVEECRLETADRLHRYITLMCVVGWRIFWMMYIKRTHPKEPASKILTKHELQTLSAIKSRASNTNVSRLTVAQAVLAIGKLGGFLARKHDRQPGPTVIWRGWVVLQNAALLGEVVFT